MCYSLWYNAATMLPATGRQHRGSIIPQTVTHSLVLLKMGKIISRNMLSWLEFINKPLLLRLVDCLYYLYQRCTVKQISDNEIYLLIKYIKSVLWRVAKCLSYIEEARCLKVKCGKPSRISVRMFDAGLHWHPSHRTVLIVQSIWWRGVSNAGPLRSSERPALSCRVAVLHYT